MSRLNKNIRSEVYNKYNGKCSYCGAELNGIFQVDHFVAKHRFVNEVRADYMPDHLKHLTEADVNHIDNLMPSCVSCNNYKHSSRIEDFRKQISYLVSGLNKNSSQYKFAKRFGLIVETNIEFKFYFEKCLD
jgi:5-methylcytosine-specific restriction endonuclease McrA